MNLSKMRTKMDKVNRKLILLLAKRLKVAKKIAKIKKAEGLLVLDSKREQDQLDSIKNMAVECQLDPVFVEEFFQELVSYTRSQMEIEMRMK